MLVRERVYDWADVSSYWVTKEGLNGNSVKVFSTQS